MRKRCPMCAQGQLVEKTGEFRATFRDNDGVERQLVVPELDWLHCPNCGEDIFDDGASQKITAAQREALLLLSPFELKRFRLGLEMTQKGIADLLGIGEKTYCRWESGSYIQSEAFDRYLRLLIECPSNIQLLDGIRKAKAAQESPVPHNDIFSFLSDVESLQPYAEKFTELLNVGVFTHRVAVAAEPCLL